MGLGSAGGWARCGGRGRAGVSGRVAAPLCSCRRVVGLARGWWERGEAGEGGGQGVGPGPGAVEAAGWRGGRGRRAGRRCAAAGSAGVWVRRWRARRRAQELGPGDQVLGDHGRAPARRRCGRSRGTGGSPGRCPCRRGCGPRRWRGRGGGVRVRRGSPCWSVRMAWKRWPSWSVKRQLRAGVRALAAHDHPRAVRPAGQVERGGDLGDRRRSRALAVLAERRPPGALARAEDRARTGSVRS